MGKIYGINGIVTGKVSNVVYSVRNGVQIARQYQPVISDRKSEAQVEVRAKFKMLTQLAAVMAPVIAIPSQANVSSRNLFLKANYGATGYADSKATINLMNVLITKSAVSLPTIRASRSAQGIAVNLNVSASDELSRVVYAMFSMQVDNSLRYVTSRVVSEPGENGLFDADFPLVGNSVVIYGYGVRDNTEAARVAFGNLKVPNAQHVAELLVSRVLTESDVTLTETRAVISNPE